MRTSSSIVPLLLLALGGGCADLFGFDELADGDRSSVVVPDASRPPEDGGPIDQPAVIADFYVSPQGDDANDGTVARPLRSVRAAVDRATGALVDGERQRIAVCAGDYPEPPLDLVGAIDLSGSYDCRTWSRRPLEDGPVGPSIDLTSRLTDTDPNAEAFITLYDDETGIPSVDGLHVTASYALGAVGFGGAGAFRHSVVVNTTNPRGATQFVTTAVAAIGSGAVLEHCDITIRHPIASVGAGGIGIGVAGGPMLVRRNVVTLLNINGRGQGLVAGERGELEVTENFFYLGNGLASAADATSVGMNFYDAKVRSTRNLVQIETPGHVTTGTLVLGVASSAPSQLASDGDRIFGPTGLRADATTKTLSFVGFYDQGGLVRLTNASIMLTLRSPIGLRDSAGIRINASSQAYIAHNTIYLKAVSAPPDPVDGGVPQDAATTPAHGLYVVGTMPPSTLSFDANLVLLDNPDMRVVRGSCASVQLRSLVRNRHSGASIPGAGGSCASDGVELEALWPGADSPESDNQVVTCDAGSCANLVETDPARVRVAGLRLTEAGCAAPLRVAVGMIDTTDAGDAGDSGPIEGGPEVPTDGTGALRMGPTTYAGAFANCP